MGAGEAVPLGDDRQKIAERPMSTIFGVASPAPAFGLQESQSWGTDLNGSFEMQDIAMGTLSLFPDAPATA